MINFNGKIAVVTGAAQGIGAAIVEKFLKEGADGVALLDMNAEALEATAKALDPEGNRTMTVICNVADHESVIAAVKAVEEKYGKIDILVNNAGITRDSMSAKLSEENFDAVMKVNLYGAFYMSQAVLVGMKERGYGRIINMSSLAHRGNVGQVNYAASKAGILGLTNTLCLEYASKGITVNAIAPGMIYTDIIKHVPEKVQESFKSMIPMKRFGEPEEVANLAAFLASDEAGYISGQCIHITGGWMR